MSRYRSAILSYLRGKDRVWEVERMRGVGGPSEEAPVEWGRVPPPPRFGIGVARTLDFQRGPAMRRDDLASGEAPNDG
jgi:hypothetical protein